MGLEAELLPNEFPTRKFCPFAHDGRAATLISIGGRVVLLKDLTEGVEESNERNDQCCEGQHRIWTHHSL
jgi:hypothetical protein